MNRRLIHPSTTMVLPKGPCPSGKPNNKQTQESVPWHRLTSHKRFCGSCTLLELFGITSLCISSVRMLHLVHIQTYFPVFQAENSPIHYIVTKKPIYFYNITDKTLSSGSLPSTTYASHKTFPPFHKLQTSVVVHPGVNPTGDIQWLAG